jgi:putative ABC transport system permease protein
MSLPSQEMNLSAFHLEGTAQDNTQALPQRLIDIDEDYLTLLDIPVVAGRNFTTRRQPTPGEGRYSVKEVLINEAMVRKMGWGPDPRMALGKQIRQGATNDESSRGKIVGVIRDFHFQSPHKPIEPLVLLNNGVFFPEKVLIRLSAGATGAQVRLVEKEWKKRVPDHPFAFSFLDQTFDGQYRQERRLGPLFTYFSGLTIFVACLGLFGLVSFATGRRTKEIGIRKVLGAGEGGLMLLLAREFLLLVGVAILLASPLAWWAMHGWLQAFAYRTSMTWWMFVGAGGVAVLVAALTTGYHAFRAARTHPVRALRYE